MGKRKKSSQKPQGSKRNEPLATVFTCLFCNHEKSVSVKLDKKAGVGTLDCKVCGQRFQCGVNYLSAAVDVYSEWVDAADAVAHKDDDGEAASYQDSGAGRLSRPAPSKGRAESYDDDDRGYGGGNAVADDDDYE